jgi:hypothetical protein
VPKPYRFSALIWLLLAFVAGAAFGQSPASPVAVRSSRPEISVAPGAVVTAPFMIRNASRDSIAIAQAISLPAGWTTVSSLAPSVLGADAMELWLVSVATPAGVAAGSYVIHAGMTANGATASDSAVVTIEERYALDVKATNAPTYVLAGDAYETTFLVRNAGNVTTRVKLKATSNRGSSPKLTAAEIDLAPGATQPVRVTVTVPEAQQRSQQDLLEIIAIDAARDTVRAATSIETTIIAKGSSGADFWTVPGDVAIRAASPGSGVSTFVASGSGYLDEKGSVKVDFAAQSAPDAQSVFGERDQYRLGLSTKNLSLRAGDQSFGFSSLTSSGSQGTGAELTGKHGGLTAGGYYQKNRWLLNSASEMAASVGSSAEATTGGSMVMLQRNSAAGASRVLAGTARGAIGSANLALEGARSDSLHQAGGAGLVRFYGSAPTFQYDLGVQHATNTFAGAQRASTDEHGSVSGQKAGPMVLSAMIAIHKTNPTALSNGFGQKISTTSVTGSFTNGSSIDLERFDRNDFSGTSAMGVRGTQQSVRGRGRLVKGNFDFLGTLQTGLVSQEDSASHAFASLSASVRAKVGRDQFVSAFADLTDGNALGAGGIGTLTGGTSAELKLGRLTALRLTTTATAQRDKLSDWTGQADITVERRVRQSIVALRGRIAASGAPNGVSQNAFYMEVRTPLRLPTSRLNVGGRARAQVVDAETGHGVQGALVRMGEVAAITDKNGIANFKGLEGGEYHAVVEGGVGAGQIVEGGNVNVVEKQRPAEFKLNVTRGARVQARLRRMEKATQGGGPTAGADSLVEVGPVNGAVLALISARDTIWQSADDRGRVDFGALPPGHYTIKVVAGDVPEFTSFDRKEMELDLKAGEARTIDFRLVPQIRTLQFMGGETVLIAAPKTRAAPSPKNNNQRQDEGTRE